MIAQTLIKAPLATQGSPHMENIIAFINYIYTVFFCCLHWVANFGKYLHFLFT